MATKRFLVPYSKSATLGMYACTKSNIANNIKLCWLQVCQVKMKVLSISILLLSSLLLVRQSTSQLCNSRGKILYVSMQKLGLAIC